MKEVKLHFPSLSSLMHFKMLSSVQDLRIDTAERSLTGRFSSIEVTVAQQLFRAASFLN